MSIASDLAASWRMLLSRLVILNWLLLSNSPLFRAETGLTWAIDWCSALGIFCIDWSAFFNPPGDPTWVWAGDLPAALCIFSGNPGDVSSLIWPLFYSARPLPGVSLIAFDLDYPSSFSWIDSDFILALGLSTATDCAFGDSVKSSDFLYSSNLSAFGIWSTL